jgi:hypothetical protein
MAYDVYDPEHPSGPIRTTYLPANVLDPGQGGGTIRPLLQVPSDVPVRDIVTTDDFQHGLEEALEKHVAIALEVADAQQLDAEDQQSIERIAADHDQIVVVIFPDADS